MRVLFVIALSALLVSCGGQIRTATAAPTATAAATGADAVMAAIEAANTAQAKAFSTGDASLMRATATTAYFAELMQTNRQLASAGVRSFELVRIDWVDVTADGATAHATTDETWRTTFADGSTDERTDRNEYALVRESGAWKIQSDVQPAAHQIDPAPAPAPRVAPTQVGSTSSNWSGYVATGGIFTSVTGTWIVPNVSPIAPGADATWVGIGGMGSSDLIQAGTQAAVGGGSVEYTAWTETLPQASQTVPLAVRPGDSVTVTLTERPGAQWGIAIVNNTTRETYKTTVPYTSSHASAEWIEEAPSAGRGIVPLDDFGAVRFTQSTAVRDGTAQTLAALGARSVAMINGARQAIAQPSALDASGAGFTVTRTAASAVGAARGLHAAGANKESSRPRLVAVSRYELEFVTQGGKELVQVRLFGQADHANLEALIAELDAAVRDRHPVGILVDESELKPGLIGVDDVRTIVVRWRKANDLRAARIAVFAPNPLVFGLNRVVESLAARDKRMTMRAFRERGSAVGWLMGFSAIS